MYRLMYRRMPSPCGVATLILVPPFMLCREAPIPQMRPIGGDSIEWVSRLAVHRNYLCNDPRLASYLGRRAPRTIT